MTSPESLTVYLVRRKSDGYFYQTPRVRYGRVERKEWQSEPRRGKLFWRKMDTTSLIDNLRDLNPGETYELVPFTLVEGTPVNT